MQRFQLPTRIAMLILFAGMVTTLSAQTVQLADEDVSWQKYQYLLRSSTLEWLYTEPFVLKIEFQLYDLQGKPVETGTAQESWGPGKVRYFRVDAPSLKEGSESAGIPYPTSHSRESFLVHQMLQAIVRPFPSPVKRPAFIMDQFQQQEEGISQDCFALSSPSERSESTSSYCTDMENHISVMRGLGGYVILRKSFRKYHYHQIPMEVTISYGGLPAISANVVELDDVPSAIDSRPVKMTTRDTPMVSAQAMSGQQLKKIDPKYPKQAKKKHIEGIVLLTGVVTKQGNLTDIEIIASPDPLLGDSAVDAIRQWTYKPYLIDGQPAEVDTSIAVNYRLHQ